MRGFCGHGMADNGLQQRLRDANLSRIADGIFAR
jgi:hypothetical protein